MAETSEMPSVGMDGDAVMEKSSEMSVEFINPKPSDELLSENAAAKPSDELLSENAAAKPSEDVSPKPLETPDSKSREVSLSKPSEASISEPLETPDSKSREVSPSKPSESSISEPFGASGEQATSTPYRLFNRQRTIHEALGGGKVADVVLWRQRSISVGLVLGGGVMWYILEKSGYSFISVVSSALLFVVVLLFTWAKTATILQRPLPSLPDLTLSEETVIRGAAKLCARINSCLAIAQDFAHGKNKKLFLKVASILFLLSFLGGMFNFLTLVYTCLLLCLIVPALYNKYEDHVDSHAERALKEFVNKKEVAQQHILKHYKTLDEKVISKIPRGLSDLSKISKEKTV